eukprot:m.16515 g.16515  ORF g.16515 m.16515 type:complete len:727 (+) comp3392_c0_seq1:25-2205(+)
MADASDEAARRRARIQDKKDRIAALRKKRQALTSTSAPNNATPGPAASAAHEQAEGMDADEYTDAVRTTSAGSPSTAPRRPSSTLEEKLARLSAMRLRRAFTPSTHATPSAATSGEPAGETRLREARTALDTAHEEIARLRETLVARETELSKLREQTTDNRPGTGGTEGGPSTLTVASDSAFAHDNMTTPRRDRYFAPEEAHEDGGAGGDGETSSGTNAALTAMMQDSMFVEYLTSLCESGADLAEITQTQAAQELAIAEYEQLLTDALEESRDLTNRLAHAQQAHQQLDGQISRYEEENLELLEELEAAHGFASRPTTTSPAAGHAETAELEREVEQLNKLVDKQERELSALRLAAQAAEKAALSKSQALEDREGRDADRERYITDLEEHVAAVEKERDEAHASLQQLVVEAGEVEEAMHSQLALAEHELASKETRHAAAERELAAIVAALQEERDQLQQHVEEQHTALSRATSRRTSAVGVHEESLAASIAEAENQCADCIVWKQKFTREASRLTQAAAKIARLEKDIEQERAATDTVVAKWTAHVKTFMAEREEWEKSKTPDPLASPPKEQEESPTHAAKSRRGLRWTRFLGRSTKRDSPTRRHHTHHHTHHGKSERPAQGGAPAARTKSRSRPTSRASSLPGSRSASRPGSADPFESPPKSGSRSGRSTPARISSRSSSPTAGVTAAPSAVVPKKGSSTDVAATSAATKDKRKVSATTNGK